MKRRQFIKGSAILGMTITNTSLLVANSGMYHEKTNRKVYRILSSDKVNVGTLPVMRAFAGNHLDHVSPYVLFDEFGPVNLEAGTDPLRVDAHPHAGVTPTTYFLEGTGHHKDSMNYDFQIGKGDFMMFSSGRGAIHMEESGQKLYDDGGFYHGFQIWLNTPSQYKFAAPATSVHREQHMDMIETKKYSIKVVLGELEEAKSKIELLSPTFYYHVKMKDDARLDIPTNPNHNAFIYLINGSLELEGGRKLLPNQVCLYQRGDNLINIYSEKKAEFLVLGGQPLNEQVYSYGPFVMNNEEQIKQCMRNYQMGLMGNPDVVNQ
ncbi:MAG: pirin-like C-terminal cupin domain-containing protein [Saprospiraceae bacterium]|jgi:redox-sensitive bicupin YhaK (pirin superfamily)|nr:pirin-like C-terminal cupin domain-containing protein [Saprospiraceae bacterium]